MGGSSSSKADRIGPVIGRGVTTWTISLASISRWMRPTSVFSTAKAWWFARARRRRRQTQSPANWRKRQVVVASCSKRDAWRRSDRIFAIGDVAACLAWRGQPVPGLAPAAKQGGGYVAKVIRRRLEGRPAPPPFGYRHAGSLATIGRQAAVADFHGLMVHGALAWWLWGGAHVLFLVGGRNRTTVLINWIWAYLTYRRASRLITDRSATL